MIFVDRPSNFRWRQHVETHINNSVFYHQNVISDKPDFFKASVVVRSQSSSSNTSRWGTGGSRNASGGDWEKGDKQVLWLRERMSGDLQNIDTVDTEQNKNAGKIH